MLIDSKSRFIEMFGDPVVSEKYERILFQDLITQITNGMGSPPDFVSKGHAFIRATNISKGAISDRDMFYISDETAAKLGRYQVHEGDFIFVRSGAYAGDVAVIPRKYDGEYGAYDINVSVDKKRINPVYLNALFNSSYMERIIRPLTSRSAQPHLNTKQVSNLSILMPPISLQNQFAEFIQQVDKSKVVQPTTTKSRFIEMFGTMDEPKVPFEQLGDVATYVNGYAFKPTDWGTEGLPIIRIQNLSGSGDSFNYYSGEYPQDIEINKGDIMISWSATLGVFVWNGPKALLNQHIFKVYFDKKDVNPTYFRVAVEPALKMSASKVHGSTMTHLTKKTFDAIKIAMPSIDQQNEFAAFVEQVDKSKVAISGI